MAPSPPPARPKLPTWALWAGVGGATLFVVIVALAVIGLATGGSDKPKAGQITGKPIKVGKDPQDIAFTPGNAWVANLKDGTVTRIDTSTDKTRAIKAEGVWVQPNALDTQALPTVMKKVIAFAMGGFPRAT